MNKSDLLSGLKDEYKQWQALLDQIGPERMDQPDVAGHWSIKDIVAHLTGWRRRTLARFQAVQRGELEPPPPWPVHLQSDDEINTWIYETNRGRPVSDILAESHLVFEQLLAAIEGIPEERLLDLRNFPWMGGQPLTAGAFFAHFHDEHEPDMRAWLERS